MRSDTMDLRGSGRGGVSPRVLALLLGGTALFLAVENMILLFVLGPALHWPAELESLALALRVARVLAEALAPWFALGMAVAVTATMILWAALKIRHEVHHA